VCGVRYVRGVAAIHQTRRKKRPLSLSLGLSGAFVTY